MFRESDLEWKFMFKVEIVDVGLVEELRNVIVGIVVVVDEVFFVNSDNVWIEVMEEDIMIMELGFVFFWLVFMFFIFFVISLFI